MDRPYKNLGTVIKLAPIARREAATLELAKKAKAELESRAGVVLGESHQRVRTIPQGPTAYRYPF